MSDEEQKVSNKKAERRQKAKAANADYYTKNRDRILQRNRNHANAHYAKNKGAILERRARARILRNKDKLRAKLAILEEELASIPDPEAPLAPTPTPAGSDDATPEEKNQE